MGEWTKPEADRPSEWEQLKQKAGDKDVLGILTLDLDGPEREASQAWFRVGVRDAAAAFGFTEAAALPGRTYKLYLKRHSAEPASYVLIHAEAL
jgi:hypothetical protein